MWNARRSSYYLKSLHKHCTVRVSAGGCLNRLSSYLLTSAAMASSLALVTLLLGGWGAGVAAESYALYSADSEVLLDASEACLAAFNANVTCPALTGELFSSPFFEFNRNTTWLDLVCATSCRESLQEHRKNVRAACTGAQYYDEFEQTLWQPWYPDDYMIYSHDIACMARR